MPCKPIFVIGRHRSGTTWLSNVIASFPEVYAPKHETHRGVHESAFFSHLVPYCRGGRTPADLLAIKHLFERSDYFMLTGLDRGPDILHHGYTEYFRLVMEAASARTGARYWLEKTPAHTLLADFLARSFPDAILIAIVRDATEVVASNVHGFGNPRSVCAWFRQAVVTAIYERIIRRSRAVVIPFEDLKERHHDTLRFIAQVLGLDGDAVPGSGFSRNTSYEAGVPGIAWWQFAAMACGRGLVRACPPLVIDSVVNRWHRRHAGALPEWFFLLASRSPSR